MKPSILKWDGRAWISYTPDGNGKTTTYGTWVYNPTRKGNGLFINLERDRGAYATRSMHLDDVAEKRLINKNYEYKKKGEDTWTLGRPCSSFARDAWNAGTKEDLNSNRVGGLGLLSNSTTLKESIIKANGGVTNATTALIVLPPLVQVVDLQVLHHQIHQEVHYEN